MSPCKASATFDPETDVCEKSVWAIGVIKAQIESVIEAKNIPVSVTICIQGGCVDPIDSRTAAVISMPPGYLLPQRTKSA